MIASFGPMTGYMGRMAHEVEEERGSTFTALNLHIGTGERKKRRGQHRVPPARLLCAEDHLAGHIIDLVDELLNVIQAPFIDRRIAIDVPIGRRGERAGDTSSRYYSTASRPDRLFRLNYSPSCR